MCTRLWRGFSWYVNFCFVAFDVLQLTPVFSQPDTKIAPGPTEVQNASLLYNEYICYDVAQVRLRYLFRIKM